jgi:hypothetical protein
MDCWKAKEVERRIDVKKVLYEESNLHPVLIDICESYLQHIVVVWKIRIRDEFILLRDEYCYQRARGLQQQKQLTISGSLDNQTWAKARSYAALNKSLVMESFHYQNLTRSDNFILLWKYTHVDGYPEGTTGRLFEIDV